jgi:class 3 adenylate cyclase
MDTLRIKLSLLLFTMVVNGIFGLDYIQRANAYLLEDEDFLFYIGDFDTESPPESGWVSGEEVSGEDLDRAQVYWKRLIPPSMEDLEEFPQSFKPLLVVESYDTPVQVYVDKGLLESADFIPEHYLGYQFYSFPELLSSRDFLLRISSNPFAGEEIYLTSQEILQNRGNRFPYMYLYQEFPFLLFALIALIIGSIMIFLFLLRRQPDKRLFLFFGIFSILYSAFTLFEGYAMNTLFPISPKLDFYIPLAASELMPLFLILFYISYYRESWRRVFSGALYLQGVVVLLRLAVMLSGRFYEWVDLLSLFTPVLIFFLLFLNLILIQWRNPYSRFFMVAFCVLALSYLAQFIGELLGILGDYPLKTGAILFYIVLAALPIYSYFQQEAYIRRQNLAFSKFVPKEMIHYLGKEDISDVALGDQIERVITIMFTDIRSFTAISETMTPEENILFLNAYLQEMVPIIRENRGIVDKFIGDGIMILFPHSPEDAVRCGSSMLEALSRWNVEKQNTNKPEIRIGIGIHTGKTMLGIVGEQERYQGTAISDAVNLASRLESATKVLDHPLLVSESTAREVSASIPLTLLSKIRVKGISEAIQVYTPAELGVKA